MKKPVSLLVLAAGMGSRYGGLKQLDSFGPCGETLMDYSVFDAARAGFDRVVFVIRRDFEELFREKVARKYAETIPVDFAFQSLDDLPGNRQVPPERVKPWGTGQAVHAARNIIDGPFAVINADDFYGETSFRNLAKELRSFEPGGIRCCMCGYRLENTLSPNGSVSRGICEAENGFLVSVTEHTKLVRDGQKIRSDLGDGKSVLFPPEKPVSMNCWGFSQEIFAELEKMFAAFLDAHGTEPKSEFYIPFVADELIRAGKTRCKLLCSPDRWFGVTYQEDRPGVENGLRELIRAGRYPERLFGKE